MTTRPLFPAPLDLGRSDRARVARDRVLHALRFGGPGFAFVLSLVSHGALALVLAHGSRPAAPPMSAAPRPLLEITAPELEAADAPASAASPQAVTLARPHSHPYPVPPNHDLIPHDPSAEHVHALSDASDVAPAATAADLPAAAPRFAMTVSPASHAPGSVVASDALANGESRGGVEAPVSAAAVDVPASLLAGAVASYTREAEAAGIEANVPLEIVVDRFGAVTEARVLEHAGYGLDQAALRGIRGYRFSPARRAGKALAVRMHWLMRFQLR